MTDKYPPPHCRQRLLKDGKAYPKSSCAACGTFSPKWKECNALLVNATITADDLLDWKRRAIAAEALIQELLPVTTAEFCEYCGGNDETPQDHCMDCAMPVPPHWVQIVVEMSDYIARIVDSQGQNRDKYPSVMRRYKLDMGMVDQARAMIAAQANSAKKSS